MFFFGQTSFIIINRFFKCCLIQKPHTYQTHEKHLSILLIYFQCTLDVYNDLKGNIEKNNSVQLIFYFNRFFNIQILVEIVEIEF